MRSKSIQEQDESFRRALRAIPVRNPNATVADSKTDPGTIEVGVQLTYRNPLARFLHHLLNTANVKFFKLDRVGTAVYRSIDGKKCFEELIDEFAQAEKLTFFESRALLGSYFQTLTGAGIIVATMPKNQRP
ncbi:MAG: PqqD family protein [Kiritimatiellia bacterium]